MKYEEMPVHWRARIENYKNEHPDWDEEKEEDLTYWADYVATKLRGEDQAYWFSVRDREGRYTMMPDLSPDLTDDELDHICALALVYFRNPVALDKVPVYMILPKKKDNKTTSKSKKK